MRCPNPGRMVPPENAIRCGAQRLMLDARALGHGDTPVTSDGRPEGDERPEGVHIGQLQPQDGDDDETETDEYLRGATLHD